MSLTTINPANATEMYSGEDGRANTTSFLGVFPVCPFGSHTMPTERHPLQDFHDGYMKIHGPLAVIICCFGMLTNAANIIVLTRSQMKSPVNALLACFALANLLVLVVYLSQHIGVFLLGGQRIPTYSLESEGGPGRMEFYYATGCLLVMLHFVATWHVIAVAALRTLVIRFPRQGSLFTQQHCAYAITAIILIVCVLVSILNWMVQGVQSYPKYHCRAKLIDIQNNPQLSVAGFHAFCGTAGQHGIPATDGDEVWCFFQYHMVYDVGLSPFAREHREATTVNYWLGLTTLKLLPSVLLSVLTVLLIMLMSSAEMNRRRVLKKARDTSKKGPTDRQRTSLMLLSVVVLYLLIELPSGILQLISYHDKQFLNGFKLVIDFLETLQNLAFSTIIFLFAAMSRKFRRTFSEVILSKLLFCRKLKTSSKRGVPITNGSSATCKSSNSFTTDETYVHSVLCEAHRPLTAASHPV